MARKFYDPDIIDRPAATTAAEGSNGTPRSNQRRNTGNSNTAQASQSSATSAQPASKDEWLDKIKAFFHSKRTRIAVGAMLTLFGTYLFIIFISYLNSGAADQSIVASLSIEDIDKMNLGDKIKNKGAIIGAIITKSMIYNGIGLAAFIVALWCVVIGIRLIKVSSKVHFFQFTFMTAINIAACMMVLGAFSLYANPLFFPIGGNMGYYSSLRLQSYIGVPGLVLLNILIVILWALVFYKTLAFIFFTIKKHIPKRTKPINEEDEVEENANENETADDNNDDTSETAEENDDENPLEPNQEEEEEERQDDNKANETMPYRINAANDSEILSDIDTTQEQDIASQLDNTTVDSNEIDGTITVSKPIEQGDEKRFDAFDPTKELSKYKMPPLDLLRDGGSRSNTADIDEQENNKRRITETLANYDIQIKKIDVCVGPTISLFEIQPCEGVRIAKIKNLSNDIQMSLAALGIRIIAPIPGKCTVGIEVPNKDPQTVYMRTILGSAKFQNCKMDLPMALGCTITNDVAIADLAKMPHLLVAGATGQGKSVGLNAIIASLLYKKHPSELKLVLIDPKMVEFSLYSKLEHHYLAKLTGENECIVIEPKKAIATLNSLVQEMENRNLLLRDAGERNIKDYNAKFIARRLNPEKGHRYMPYIVLVVDEYADLVMTGGKEVERPIARIAQKARAVGIHMIIATQRPSTDVITGMIKANFPGRIAFKVVQMVDSRTILDCPGAEQLVGRGDMLFSAAGSVVERIQCAFIDTPEVESICDYISSQVGYDEAYELPEYIPDTDEQSGGNDQGGSMNLNDRDPLFDEIAQYIVASDTASTSSLQRHYNIGYNRAGRIMDQMEAAGIVGPAQGGKPRKVLIDATQLQSMLAQKLF